MPCELCGRQATTEHIVFHQNIGVIFARYPSKVEGELCKRCIHKTFWRMTLVSMVAGWWGIISFISNFFFIINNINTYARFLFTPPAPVDSPSRHQAPDVVDYGSERLEGYRESIGQWIAAGDSSEAITKRLSDFASVPMHDAQVFLESIRSHLPA